MEKGIKIGVKDKNGRDICNGDTVKDDAGIGEIVYLMEHCQFVIKASDAEQLKYYVIESDGQLKNTEVI